jgi:hypothetical protein
MKPFIKIPRSVATSMEQRLALLQQPCEFFRQFCGGRTPSLTEKILLVEQVVQRMTSLHTFENDVYHVEINYRHPYINLDIKRLDGGSEKNWRDFQQIKNELIGPEHEAVELFPAESRLVDTSNQYHLWVHVDPGFRFPFGVESDWIAGDPGIGSGPESGPGGHAELRTLAVDHVAHAAAQ